MNKTNQVTLNRYQFAWLNNNITERKRFRIQLTDLREQEPKNNNQRYKNRFRRFLIRLRSD